MQFFRILTYKNNYLYFKHIHLLEKQMASGCFCCCRVIFVRVFYIEALMNMFKINAYPIIVSKWDHIIGDRGRSIIKRNYIVRKSF